MFGPSIYCLADANHGGAEQQGGRLMAGQRSAKQDAASERRPAAPSRREKDVDAALAALARYLARCAAEADDAASRENDGADEQPAPCNAETPR
jgi:hypothetical protein